MTKEKARNRVPFTMHSSSATGGYHDKLDKFKKGVDITNLHTDTYGDFKDAPMQGPFTEKYVGGHQRRHQGIVLAGDFEIVQSSIWEESPLLVQPLANPTGNDNAWEVEILDGEAIIVPATSPSSNSIWEVVGDEIMPLQPYKDFYQVQKRGEAFYIIPVTDGLRVYGADYRGTATPRAIYYRDEFAKRPVNIRNIASNTGSGPFEGPGNFDHNYEVVQTTGRTTNPRHFAESVDSYQKFQERKAFEGDVMNSFDSFGNLLTGSLRDFTLPVRTKHKSVIVNRFSAPGDRYTMSRGFLNPSGEELSVYNATPFRNEKVRADHNKRLSKHMTQQGYEAPDPDSVEDIPSIHKINRNRLNVLTYKSSPWTVFPATGQFVYHQNFECFNNALPEAIDDGSPDPGQPSDWKWTSGADLAGNNASVETGLSPETAYGFWPDRGGVGGSPPNTFGINQAAQTQIDPAYGTAYASTALLAGSSDGEGTYSFPERYYTLQRTLSLAEAANVSKLRFRYHMHGAGHRYPHYMSRLRVQASLTPGTIDANTVWTDLWIQEDALGSPQMVTEIKGEKQTTPQQEMKVADVDLTNYVLEMKPFHVRILVRQIGFGGWHFNKRHAPVIINRMEFHRGYVDTLPITGSQYDNFYVQRPIPRSDLSYSWIHNYLKSDLNNMPKSGSLFGYQTDSSGIANLMPVRSRPFPSSSTDVSFLSIAHPMQEYDPSTSTISKVFPLSGAMSGAYGFSSWEQTRKHDSQHARYLRDSNTFSFLTDEDKDPAKITSVTQPPVTMKYKPIKQEVLLSNDPSNTTYEMVSTLSNDLEFFSEQKNVDVESLLGLSNEEKETFYEKVKNLYLDPDPDLPHNPIREVRGVKYAEKIYPIDRFSGLKTTRVRENYTEVSGAAEEGINKQFGKQNNFYHSTILRSARAKNSFNFTPRTGTVVSTTTDYVFSSGLPSDFISDGTSGTKYDSSAAKWAFVFGDQTSGNVSSRYLQYTKAVSGQITVTFDYIKGTYTGLGLEQPDYGEGISIQYRESGTSSWIVAKAIGGSSNTDASILNTDGSNSSYTTFVATMSSRSIGSYAGRIGTQSGADFAAGTEIRIVQTNFSGYQYDNWAIFGLSITAATVSSEKESLALFPMQTDGATSFPQESSYRSAIGELMHDTDESAYGDDPIPSPCFVEYTNINISGATSYILSDYVERLTEKISGRTPGFESYEDFREDFRPVLKTGGVIPEFRISEHIDEYFSDMNFSRPPADYFTIQGGKTPKGDIQNSSKADSFFEKHLTTEPMSRAKSVVEDHPDLDVSRVRIKCNAIKKLLPYNGFFPVTRTTQIANEFSSSYAEHITGYRDDTKTTYPMQGLQAISKALMSPGILYNTIKAGYAVDYPVYTGSVPSTTLVTEAGLNPQSDFALETGPDYRLPFETLYDAKGNLPQETSIRFTPSYVSTEPISPSFPFYAKWSGKSRPNYQLAMHNFLAESVEFFMDNGTLNYFVSKPENQFEEFEAGNKYYMDVVVRDNLKMDNFSKYKGTINAKGNTYINEGGVMSDFVSGSDGYYAAVFAHGSKAELKENRLTLYRNKLDAEGWVYIDRVSFADDSTGDQHRTVAIASGSSEMYVAIGNPNDYSLANEGSVRVYHIRKNLFDKENFDRITGSYHKPPYGSKKMYDYGSDCKIAANKDGYNLATSDSAHGSVPITLYPEGGKNTEVSSSITAPANTGLIFLYSSSSYGIKENNVFHNILPGSTTNRSRMGYAGTYELINLEYEDDSTQTYPSSSMNGVLVVAGVGRHPGSHSSNDDDTQPGGMCLFYSGSVYGTGSAYFYNNGGTFGDTFGTTVAACMNGTNPYQKYYIAASIAARNYSYTPAERKDGAVFIFTGSVYQPLVDLYDTFGEVTASQPTGEVSLDFGITQVIDSSYLSSSGFNATAQAKEFGTDGGGFNNRSSDWALGSTLSLDSSRFEPGKQPEIFLGIGNHNTTYHLPETTHGYSANTSGSLFVIQMSGNGLANNNLTILPTERLSGMDSSYIYGRNVFRNTTRAGLKIISGSLNPYNTNDGIAVFTNPKSEYDNYLSADPTGKDFVVMFTGSTWKGTNSYSGRNDTSSGNKNLKTKFSSSLNINASFEYLQDGKLYGLPLEYPHDPSYCAYTPPSYYGASTARIIFEPEVSGKYSLSEILSQASVEDFSSLDDDRVSVFSTINRKNLLSTKQKKAKMPVSSSIDLFGKTSVPLTEFELLEDGTVARPTSAAQDTTTNNQQWVISTKFESPILDFSTTKTKHSSSYSSHLPTAMEAHGFTDGQTFESPRGMWLSYGTVPEIEKGIFMEVKESFSPEVYQNPANKTKSLISATGFTADSKKLGRMRNKKEISEAICIIPYVKTSNSENKQGSRRRAYGSYRDYRREYFTADRPLIIAPRFNTTNILRYSPTRHPNVFITRNIARNHWRKRVQFANDHDLVEINGTEFLNQKKVYEETLGRIAVKKENSATGKEIRETSISKMIKGLKEYIVPPHLDPLSSAWRGADNPFAMYFVEVSHDLDSDDLSNIWQNVNPDIAINFETSEIDISHDLNEHNFFSTSDGFRDALNKDLSFIVFKVKKRAKINYFETTKDSTDDSRFRFDLKGGTQEVIPEYSYNWPYDYFSLIESAEISMEVEMQKPAPPAPPPTISRKRRSRRRSLRRMIEQNSRPRRNQTHRPKNRRVKKDGNPYSKKE